MKRMATLLKESLPDVVGTLISTAILAIISLLSGVFNIDIQLSHRIIILSCYSLLWIGTIYIFIAKQRSIIDPKKFLHQFGWRTKLISVVILLIASGLVF